MIKQHVYFLISIFTFTNLLTTIDVQVDYDSSYLELVDVADKKDFNSDKAAKLVLVGSYKDAGVNICGRAEFFLSDAELKNLYQKTKSGVGVKVFLNNILDNVLSVANFMPQYSKETVKGEVKRSKINKEKFIFNAFKFELTNVSGLNLSAVDLTIIKDKYQELKLHSDILSDNLASGLYFNLKGGEKRKKLSDENFGKNLLNLIAFRYQFSCKLENEK